MASFVLLWGAVIAGIVSVSPAGRLLWLAPLGGLVGFAAADFVGGCVHWVADTYFHPRTPLLGPLLVAPFRAHHSDPAEITQHGFLELLGNNALATLPLGLALLVSGGPGMSLSGQALHVVVSALAIALFATNAFHCWAHMAVPPPGVAWLQRVGLVLSPEMHARHHRASHDQSYCVTAGWLNPALDRVGFFVRAEVVLARILTRFRRSAREAGR